MQPTVASLATQRVVRVLISSTFRDMHAEGEELVKQVFTQLRRLCEKRGVTWADVDLRWGITDQQEAGGKVLPICIAEINNCRPHFIGLLVERYGRVSDEIPQELIEQEPWIEQHSGHSGTELEILRGELNNPEMANRAYFYFRDPAYIEQVPSDKKADFIETGAQARAKLAAIKERIRRCDLAVREDYPDGQTLGGWVLHDLGTAICQDFPDAQLSPLDREAAEHEAFAQIRPQVYIRRDEYFRGLDEHARGSGNAQWFPVYDEQKAIPGAEPDMPGGVSRGN